MTSSYESLFNWLPPSSSPLGLVADDPHSLDMPLIDRSESALLSNLLASGSASFSPTPASYHNNKSIASTTSTTIRKRAAHEMSSTTTPTTSSTTSYGLNDELSMLKRMYAGAHSVLGHASSNAVSVQATPFQSAHSKFAGDSTTMMMTPPPPQGAAGSLAPTAAAVNHFMYELTHNGSFAPLPSSSNASVEYLYVDDGVSAKKHTSSTSATSGGVGAILGVPDASHVDAVAAAALAASAASVSASSPVAAAASPTPSDPYALQSPPPPSLPLLADLSAMHAHVPPPYVPPPAEPAPPLSAYDSAVRINAIFSARHALGEYLPSGTGSNNNSSGDDATTNPNAEDDAIDLALLESDGVRRMKRRATDKQRRAKIKDGLELLRSLVALHGNSSTDQASIVLSSVDLVQQLVSQATALRDDVRTAQHEATYLKSLAAKCESAIRSGFAASSVLSSGAAASASASASAGAASSVTAHGKHGNSSRHHTRSSSSAAKAAPVAPRQQVHRASSRAVPSSQQHDVYPGPSIITHQPATATATVARMPVAATRAAPAAPTLTSSPESIHHSHHQSNAPLPFYAGAGLAPVAPAHIVSAPVYSATTFDRAPSYNAAVSSLSSSQSQSSSSSQSYHTDAMYGSTSMMYEPVEYPTSATTSLSSSSYHSVSRSSENVVNAVASYGPTVGYEASSSVASSSSPSMMTNSADMWSMRWDQSALGRSSSLGMPTDFSLFRSSSIDQSLPFSAYPPQALPQSSSQVHEQQQYVQHYPQQQQQYQPHAATSTIESASEAAQHPQPTIAGLVEELQALTAAASLLSATSAARGQSPVSSSSSSSASPVPTASVSPSAASVAVAVPSSSSSSSLAHSPQPSTSFSSPSPSAAAPTSLVAKLIQSDPSLAESLDNLLLNSYFLQTLRVLSKQPASSSSSSSP